MKEEQTRQNNGKAQNMTDHEIALAYAPIVHFDQNETIPLRAVGYTVVRESQASESFPKRNILIGGRSAFAVEYAYYWDYDIQHMYDLEHIWVNVGEDGLPLGAEGSFHGGFIPIYTSGVSPLTGRHVHTFCQPGKHAFLGNAQMFEALPDVRSCCNEEAGGPVLVGGPFGKIYAPTAEDDAASIRYIRTHLAFDPTLRFTQDAPEDVAYMPWTELKEKIPAWIRAECARIRGLR